MARNPLSPMGDPNVLIDEGVNNSFGYVKTVAENIDDILLVAKNLADIGEFQANTYTKSETDNLIKNSLTNYLEKDQWWPDDAEVALDFINQRYKAGKRMTFDGVFDFERATAALYTDNIIASAGEIRLENDGLLLENAAANLVENPTFNGGTIGVIGSGGALPTRWALGDSGFTIELIAKGKENNKDFARFKISRNGYNAVTTFVNLRSSPFNNFPTVPGPVTGSVELRVVESTGAFSHLNMTMQQYTAGNVFIGNVTGHSIYADQEGISYAFANTAINGHRIALCVVVSMLNDSSEFSVTFDVIGPMMTATAASTPSTYTATTRDADEFGIKMAENGAYSMFTLHTNGARWDDVTASNNLLELPNKGTLYNKLMNVGVFPPALSFDEKAAYVDELIPPKMISIMDDDGIQNGENYWGSQSAFKSWSQTIATNKNNLRRFELQAEDYWYGDGNRNPRPSRSEAYQRAAHTIYGLGATGVAGRQINASGSFRFMQGLIEDAPGNFCSLMQFHSHVRAGDPGLQPCFIMNLKQGGVINFESRSVPLDPPNNNISNGSPPSTLRHKLTGFEYGQWYYFWFRLKIGLLNDGELEFWLNGTRIINLVGINIGVSDRGHYLKYGLYRNQVLKGEIPSIVDFANVRHSGSVDLSAYATTPEDIC